MKKKLLSLIIAVCLIIPCALCLVACGEKEDKSEEKPAETVTSLYNINFDGNIEGEKYDVKGTTWTKSEEEGFEAVYTLTGEVAYNKAVADTLGYTDGRVNFALIRFTSDTLTRVEWNEKEQTGFYCVITNYVGTAEETSVTKHGGFSSGNEETKQTTYFLYQGVDNTVRTLTVKISFDGTEANARLYKFVIDPTNYTLASAPTVE